MARNKKGTVGIYSQNGYLYLSWSYQAKQYRLATGLPDSKDNRKALTGKRRVIEADIAYERLDLTLEKYGKRPRGVAREIPLETRPQTCADLLERFILQKHERVHERTLIKYKALLGRVRSNSIGSMNPTTLSEGEVIAFLKALPMEPRTRKERLGILKACWQWGMKEGYVQSNPFADIAIKVPPKPLPKPFSGEEIHLIINGFEQLYPHYVPYVRFLLASGVRVSEAIGLRWEHVDFEKGTIWIGESLCRGERKATKTNKARVFPMNEGMRYSLLKLKEKTKTELVFVSPKGLPIDDHNFSQRIWTTVLDIQGVPYRKPYNCRHTFISHLLERGIPPTVVAKLTGHNVKTLYENYAGSTIQRPNVPEIF